MSFDLDLPEETPEDLERRLRELDIAYYRDARPLVEDAEYDALRARYDRLAAALGIPPEKRYTRSVGDDHSEGFATVVHERRMLSLEKAVTHYRFLRGSREDFPAAAAEALPKWTTDTSWGCILTWARRQGGRLGLDPEALPLVVEPKIDGISVSLRYEGGTLRQAATRGDGVRGDVITAQVLAAGAAPASIPCTGRVEVRGELYLPKAAFARLNALQEAEGGELFANPRNACAGLLKRLDPSSLTDSGIRSFLYLLLPDLQEVELPASHLARLGWMREQGFSVHDRAAAVTGVSAAYQLCLEAQSWRHELDHEIDGMVLKLDDTSLWDRLEETEHHPGWGIAYKFPAEWRRTQLTGITVQVGRMGALTPVAELAPVQLAGTVVSRASLHNRSFLARLDARVGDAVWVQKAGEIIPQVVGVDLSSRPPEAVPFDFPAQCPVCGAPIENRGTGADEFGDPIELWACSNADGCPAQLAGRLEHLASRRALDLESLGGTVAEALVRGGLVHEVFDIFSLSRQDFASLNLGTAEAPRSFGEKNAIKLREALERSRTAPLSRWIHALAIPEVGEAGARALALSHASLEALAGSEALRAVLEIQKLEERRKALGARTEANRARSREEKAAAREEQERLRREISGLQEKVKASGLADIGPSVAQRVLDFFVRPRGLHALRRFHELNIRPTPEVPVEGPLSGKTFVVTGTLEGMSREEAKALIRAAGGRTAESVSRQTSWLLAGEAAGSKLARAEALGIPVLSLEALRQMLTVGNE